MRRLREWGNKKYLWYVEGKVPLEEDELKDMCMSVYIEYGERCFDIDKLNIPMHDIEDMVAIYECLEFLNPGSYIDRRIKLTSEALELIRS